MNKLQTLITSITIVGTSVFLTACGNNQQANKKNHMVNTPAIKHLIGQKVPISQQLTHLKLRIHLALTSY